MTTSKRRFLWWSAALLAALAAAALPIASRAADKSEEAAKAASELSLIPSDGAVVVSLRMGELWNSEAFKPAREKMKKEHPEMADVFAKQLGVAPEEIERVTEVMLSMESGGEWLSFITTKKPYDVKKVAATAPGAQVEKIKNRTLYDNSHGPSIALLTDRTFLIGSAAEVKRYLHHAQETKEGPLTPALRAAENHYLAAGVNVPLIAETAPKELPPQIAVLKPLLNAQSAFVTVDLDAAVKVEGKLTFAGELDAKAGEKAANAALDMARGALAVGLPQMEKQKELAPFVSFMEKVQAGLRTASVQRKDAVVQASGTVKVDLRKAAPEFVDAVQKLRETATRMRRTNNLKQLALAMYNYQDAYGHFPADAIYDKNGKPLLSWRVMVLPYIEQDALYKQFHLDEPWDSDHNKKLLEKMPPWFAAGDEQALKNHETHYQGFVGKGAFFDGKKGIKATEIVDGASNTIMLVEAKKAVPWSKPEDVPFDAGKLVPKLGGLFDGIFNAAFADGSVHSMPLTISEEKLRAYITRNGGEVIQPDK